jgi:hypothetical protein
MDARLEFSDNQDVAASTLSSGSSVTSTNIVDLGANSTDYWADAITMDVGEAGGLMWTTEVSTEATAGGTVTATLQYDGALSGSDLSSGNTIATVTFAAGSAIGTKRSVKVPTGTIERYLAVVYTASGGNVTAGKFDSYLPLDHSTP